MDRYCIRTRLLEKPDVCLYYKGIEKDNTVAYALNVVVAFTIKDAWLFEEGKAKALCRQLNEDREALLERQFSEFEIIEANSD